MIPDWSEEREQMVERQIRARGVRDERVLEAMLRIPRELFVPPEYRVCSYRDEPVPIGFGQTISQPYMTAFMAELLELQGHETVLDIGAGSGYHAAVLGALASEVISVEIVPALAAVAQENLARAGRAHNVRVVCGDGSRGFPERAPFQAISVAAAAPEAPAALFEQLADPGRMVIPVGDLGDQELLLYTKRGGTVQSMRASHCRFVPLRGNFGWH